MQSALRDTETPSFLPLESPGQRAPKPDCTSMLQWMLPELPSVGIYRINAPGCECNEERDDPYIPSAVGRAKAGAKASCCTHTVGARGGIYSSSCGVTGRETIKRRSQTSKQQSVYPERSSRRWTPQSWSRRWRDCQHAEQIPQHLAVLVGLSRSVNLSSRIICPRLIPSQSFLR